MAQKRRFSFLIPILVLLCALLGGVYGPRVQVASAASGDDDVSAGLHQFTKVYTTVQENFADPVSPDKAIYKGAIPGMLRTLDPHSNFFDPKDFDGLREEQRGHYYGVGMSVVGRNGKTQVVVPFVGSPAYKAGLRPGDIIIEVNDKSTEGLDSTKVADLLKGPKGTAVQIKVAREGYDKPVVFNIIRDEINRKSVPEAFLLKPNVGYVKIEQFNETTGHEFEEAMKEIDEDHLKGLVLDLRSNPGGLLTEAVSVVDHLIPRGDVIVSHKGRNSPERVYTARNGNHGRAYPIVVVVNRNSASASEIVSGALQDHDRAWILGDNTFGKGLVQTVYPLIENTGLTLTTAKYYTPSGRLIQRDYSNVSFFDYYYKTNTATRNMADVKMTDSGRTVYGGGGISPDEKFTQEKLTPFETELYVKYVWGGFTQHFFAVHRDKLPAGWNVDTKTMDEFHQWLLDQKIEFTEADFTRDFKKVERRLQSEIYKTAFSVDDSMMYDTRTDPEVEAAVEAMPKAETLLNTAHKIVVERMKKVDSHAQIAVLDAGGQYCHLIARKVRDLGVSSEVFPSETPLEKLRHARGIIISGGPSSVYDSASPTIEPSVLGDGIPVLGICYGQQLIAHLLGGNVRPGDKGEFGLAVLNVSAGDSEILRGVANGGRVWMSHRDVVSEPPTGFRILAVTSTCETAAIEDTARRIYAVQFHPEVVHTTDGVRILENFVMNICGCVKDWNASQRIALIEEQIRKRAGERRVFFFVSGGVDSTVAFMLCLDALGSERVRGVYVDTGLMRKGETEFIRETFDGLGLVRIEECQQEFLTALEQVRDPELKRHIIGEQFVKVQERIIEERGLLSGRWILGQGTIYPDTIESGGTAKSATIKTHHNRVPGIQKLIEDGCIVEPLADFYKDEVRAIGRELGIAPRLLERHPFPGPGLAIRCLCSDANRPIERLADGYLLPIRSVGVQGDSRSYAPVFVIDAFPSEEAKLQDEATELINRGVGANRVIARVATREPLEHQRVFSSTVTHGRLELLRAADAIVRELSEESGFDKQVWQFPVVLIPLGAGESRDSVVLRPIQSVDGMTADSVNMPGELLHSMAERLMAVPEIAGVYYDLTHKPPGTIEWE